MKTPRNGKGLALMRGKSSKQGTSPASTRGKAEREAAPFEIGANGSEADNPDVVNSGPVVLDALLADEIAEDSGECLGMRHGESPDKTLQRECMLALREPGLKPHERLKIIQTLDKVNERIARSGPKEDVAESLHAWIAEVMDGGPGPMNEAAP
jgi:hypothetical protein